MQKEANHRKFDTAVTKVQECVTSSTGVPKNVIKRTKKELLNLQATVATSYNTPEENKNHP
jgi:hypothetical protein